MLGVTSWIRRTFGSHEADKCQTTDDEEYAPTREERCRKRNSVVDPSHDRADDGKE